MSSRSILWQDCWKYSDRRDLLAFAAYLRDEKEQAPRSCWNKFLHVVSFLKAYGVRGLAKKEDWPQFVEEEPEIYEQEELDALFSACSPEERLRYEFFLMTGMRDQEVMHTYWSDINFRAGTVRVSHKADRGWTPKAYKEREIPIPDRLAESLKAWKRAANKNCNLVIPDCRLPTEHALPGGPERHRQARQPGPKELLVAQVPRDVCYVASLEGR